MGGGKGESMTNGDAKQVVDAVFTYLYNRSQLAIVLDVFCAEYRSPDDLLPAYVAENVQRLARSVASFYGHLDDDNQQRFVDLALAWKRDRGAYPVTSSAKISQYVVLREGR